MMDSAFNLSDCSYSIYSVKCSTFSIELASNRDHFTYLNEEHFTE